MLELWMIMQNKMQHFLSIWDINGFKWHKIIWFCIFLDIRAIFIICPLVTQIQICHLWLIFKKISQNFNNPKYSKICIILLGGGYWKWTIFNHIDVLDVIVPWSLFLNTLWFHIHLKTLTFRQLFSSISPEHLWKQIKL